MAQVLTLGALVLIAAVLAIPAGHQLAILFSAVTVR
jgi:hypothetical protein